MLIPGVLYFYFYFYLISLIADGPHHYHPACGHKGSSTSYLSPVHALQFFYRDASSALLQLVNQWLNFTYSRSHAFRYLVRKKERKSYFGRIELTTSALAGVQITYYLIDHSGDECTSSINSTFLYSIIMYSSTSTFLSPFFTSQAVPYCNWCVFLASKGQTRIKKKSSQDAELWNLTGE